VLKWLRTSVRGEPKRPIDELVAELSRLDEIRESLWRHRKGGVYRIVRVAFREQTMTPEVVYEDSAHPVAYIRPYDEFMDGRFERIETE